MAVPQGSVVFYSPNVLHRANVHDAERIILTLTLMGEHGLVPNGISLAVEPQVPEGGLPHSRSEVGFIFVKGIKIMFCPLNLTVWWRLVWIYKFERMRFKQ